MATARRPSQVWSTNLLTSFADNTIDVSWQHFLSLEFDAKYQKEVGLPLFLQEPEFPYNTYSVGQMEGNFRVKTARFVQSF